MLRTQSMLVLAGLLAVTPCAGLVLDQSEPLEQPTLTVCVYNYAALDQAALQIAADKAAEKFTRAGARTSWVLCDPRRTHGHCYGRSGPDTVQVRLINGRLAGNLGLGPAVFGYAAASKTGGYSRLASVFWDRILEGAPKIELDPTDLLAAVMAHEIGHLLLGPDSHTSADLMTGHWKNEEHEKIGQNRLHFLGSTRRAIRDAVRKRVIATQAD